MLCQPPSEKCVVSRQGWTRSACGRAPGLEAKLARGPALPGLADPPEAGPSLTAGTGARIPLLLGAGLRPGILRRTESPWNAWHSARLLLHSSIRFSQLSPVAIDALDVHRPQRFDGICIAVYHLFPGKVDSFLQGLPGICRCVCTLPIDKETSP